MGIRRLQPRKGSLGINLLLLLITVAILFVLRHKALAPASNATPEQQTTVPASDIALPATDEGSYIEPQQLD